MSEILHRHGGIDWASPEECPYCALNDLQEENAQLREEVRSATSKAWELVREWVNREALK